MGSKARFLDFFFIFFKICLLMLALPRMRCLPPSLRLIQIRTLRTSPSSIPSYHKSWDPTIHKPARCTKPLRIRSSKVQLAVLAEEHGEQEGQDGQCNSRNALTAQQRLDERKKLMAFNKLQHMQQFFHQNRTQRANLWKAYKLAKHADQQLPSRLSDSMWESLWDMESVRGPDNPRRTLHLEELYRDLISTGRSGTLAQKVEYLECLFLNGSEEEALDEWERDQVQHSTEPEYLGLGAKLYALSDHIDNARALMDKIFEMDCGYDSSIALHVIRAHTSSDREEHHDAAMDIYSKLKARENVKMTAEDYDACLVGFLEAKHATYAKQVFQDMIKDGLLAAALKDNSKTEVLTRLNLLYRLGTDTNTRAGLVLCALEVLPEDYHSHIYGDWMQLAVIEKKPEAVTAILDIMLQSGSTPQTFHFNLLLRAFLRTKHSPKVLKAENIGWKMIDEARKVHYQSLRLTSSTGSPRKHTKPAEPQSLENVKVFPPANQTTVAMIMQHHADKLQWEHVDYLQRKLKGIGITPNSSIMNVLLSNKFRQGAYTEAWTIYKQLTGTALESPSDGVFPSGATFRILWMMLQSAYRDVPMRSNPSLPTPRELLRETLEWWAKCRSRYDATRFQMGLAGSKDLAISPLILHCFSYKKDFTGSIVALHVLRNVFNIFPTARTETIIRKQTVLVDWREVPETEKMSYWAAYKSQTRRVERVYRYLSVRRLTLMNLDPTVSGRLNPAVQLSDEEIGDLRLNLLSEFMRVILKRGAAPIEVELGIEAAKREVGVPDMGTGDLNAFEVE
ncbi:hypothetical protein GQ44DRAFT_707559, partial [Phaeosphaeriaceae sp. PMI808]